MCCHHVLHYKSVIPSYILYLLQFLHHLFDAQISAGAHFVLHLSQPITELLVLVVEDCPGVETVCNFLPTRRYLVKR